MDEDGSKGVRRRAGREREHAFWPMVLLLGVCAATGPGQWGLAQDPASAPDAGARRCAMGWNLRAVVGSDVKDIRAAVDVWLVELGRMEGLRAESRMYTNMRDMLRDLKAGKLDIVSGTALDYLGICKNVEVELAFVGVRQGRKAHSYRVLVHGDSGIMDVAGLKGKRLAVKHGEEMGRLYLNTLLLRHGMREAPSCFSTVVEKGKFSQAVLAVFFGQADACVVTEGVLDTMIALNPQIGQRLKVLASSPRFVAQISFFRKEYDADARRSVVERALSLTGSAPGRQLLTLFRLDRLGLVKESDLDTVRDLLGEYERLGGRCCATAGD